MPVTKTAKRALRGSKRKELVNKKLLGRLEISVRFAKKTRREEDLKKAISLTDRAAKSKIIHKNKAARMKKALSEFSSQKEQKAKKLPKKLKKTSNKKK